MNGQGGDHDKGGTPRGGSAPAREMSREDRLKAALKANMARRKAQARARGADQARQDQDES
jgi:hypothetical protein